MKRPQAEHSSSSPQDPAPSRRRDPLPAATADSAAGCPIMIRIDMIRQDTRHPHKRQRHQGRAICEVAGQRFEAQGPAPVYKLATLLWLHGHGGADFEVWDDRSPSGKSGGLAMRGKVRNWAMISDGKASFMKNAKPEPDFSSHVREFVARAAGQVAELTE